MVPDIRRAGIAGAALIGALHECFAVRGGFGAKERIEAGAFGGERAAVGVARGAWRAASVVMGSAAPAAVVQQSNRRLSPEAAQPKLPEAADPVDDLRDAVLNALSGAGHRMLVNMLETGEWQVEGNELVIKVASSATVIEMSLGADAKRLMIATASGALGRADEAEVVPGGVAPDCGASSVSNGGGRGRAEQDPMVRRMKEKFGAEIRTIIDYKEKR